MVASARSQLPPGTVIDGEVVIWNGDRLDFGLLQRRMITAPERIGALVAAHPASYVAFDLLAAGGADQRAQPCGSAVRSWRDWPGLGRRRCSCAR